MNVAAICARGGSKGVPRKNLRLLAGEPLIVHTIRCALRSRSIDRVVVSTDDPAIAEVARKAGAEVPFMRPAELAMDDTPKWLVFRHLISEFEKLTSEQVDLLADLDTGVPLRAPEDVDGTIVLLKDSNAEVAITGYEADRNPYFNMVEQGVDGLWRVCKSPRTPITRRQDAPSVFSLSPAVFAMTRDAVLKRDHWSSCNLVIYPMNRDRAIDIDSELDFKLVECLNSMAAHV